MDLIKMKLLLNCYFPFFWWCSLTCFKKNNLKNNFRKSNWKFKEKLIRKKCTIIMKIASYKTNLHHCPHFKYFFHLSKNRNNLSFDQTIWPRKKLTKKTLVGIYFIFPPFMKEKSSDISKAWRGQFESL